MADTTNLLPLTDEAIKSLAHLTRLSETKIDFLQLPKDLLPRGATVDSAYVLTMIDGDGKPVVQSIRPLVEEYRGKPVHRTGTALAKTLDSFIELVRRHGDSGSAVFAHGDWTKPRLTAVIDYHKAVVRDADTEEDVDVSLRSPVEGDDPHARYGKHRILYEFPISPAWQVWTSGNGVKMSQADFAAFLEEHFHEIAMPDENGGSEREWVDMFKTRIATPSDLVTLSRELEVFVGASYKSKTRLGSGETQLVYETEHKDAAGAAIDLPGMFIVSVAPFYRGALMKIPARLRYRPTSQGAVSFWYELYRPDLFIDDHVLEAAGRVNNETGLPIYEGTPEGGL